MPLLILDQKSKKSNNFAWRGLEPTTMRSRAERSNHLGQLSHSKRSDDIMHEKKVYLLPHFLSLTLSLSHTQQHAHRCAPSRHRPSTARQQLFMRASRASPFHSRDADGDGSRITLDLGTSRKAPVRMKGVVGELCHQRGFVHARLEEQRKGGHRRRVSHGQAFQRARAATCEACGGGVGRFGEFSLE